MPRWREVLRAGLAVQDHNNMGELRVLVLAVRRLARAAAARDRRVLLASDSRVAIGALSKGRSRSWALLRLTRIAAAVVVACGIRPYTRYI